MIGRQSKQAVCSSTDHGGGEAAAGVRQIIACPWPPLVELTGHRPTDQFSFFLHPEAF
jgi:hypothetical protein